MSGDRPYKRRGKIAAIAIAAFAGVSALAHVGVGALTSIRPPPIGESTGEAAEDEGDPEVAVLGPAWRARLNKLWVVSLQGTPQEIGHQHARLLGRQMRDNEARLFDLFERFVPLAPA